MQSLVTLRRIIHCRNHVPNFTSIRKINYIGRSDQESTVDMMDHKDVKDHPTVYVISQIQGIKEHIQCLNKGISVKNLPVSNTAAPVNEVSELETAEIIIADGHVIAHNHSKMPHLKWAHCTWAGVEPLFKTIKAKPPFIVTRHAHKDFSMQIAHYVMTHVLETQLYKSHRIFHDACREKNWGKMIDCCSVQEKVPLQDLCIGMLGVGNMGQAIAKFFKSCGTKTIGLSRTPKEISEFGSFDRIEVSLPKVLSAADYIVNTLPSTPKTVGLLNGDNLQACGKGKVFINVGRGDIVSEDTLLRALKEGWLKYAVLDVFQEEPLPKDSLLWGHNQIKITPHIAAISTPKNIAEDFVDSYFNYMQNQPLKNVVDWEKGY